MRKEGIDLKIDFLDDLPEVDVSFLQIQQCFIDRIITDHGGGSSVLRVSKGNLPKCSMIYPLR